MRVAQIIRRFTFSEWGGTENVVFNTAKALVKSQIYTQILCTRALNKVADEKVEDVEIKRFKYFYPYFPLSDAQKMALDKKGGNPFVPDLERYLLDSDFDLFHCHNLGRMAQLTARAAAKKHKPFVLSLHGGCLDVPENERIELLRPMKNTIKYGGIIERLFKLRTDAIALASGIICVGENEYAQFKERFPDKKICFLPNGVSPEKYQQKIDFDWRRELNLTADCKLLLNISRIDYQKNQIMLIELIHELKKQGENVHLLLIGPVSAQWYYEKICALIKQYNLEDAVTIIPGLHPDDPKLVGAYLQADMFILPSFHEPFGIVVLEAWSSKLPVLGARVGGLGKLIKDGENGILFDPGQLDSLLEGYRRINNIGSSLIDRAFEEVRNKYDWQIVGEQLKSFYAEVIDEYRK